MDYLRRLQVEQPAIFLVLIALGPEVIVVTGAGTTVQVWTDGVGSTLPARSTVRIRIVCSPGPRLETDSGEAQGSNGALSREH